jgi:PleD family two-component response regulator
MTSLFAYDLAERAEKAAPRAKRSGRLPDTSNLK